MLNFFLKNSFNLIVKMNAGSKSLNRPKNRWKNSRKRSNKDDVPVSTVLVSKSSPEERSLFIRKTYLHLALAIALFVLLEIFLLSVGFGQKIIDVLLVSGWWSILFLLAFIVFFLIFFVIAKELVNSDSSKSQYFGFGLYIFADATIITPLLTLLKNRYDDGLILEIGILTFGLFLGITAVAFLSRKDFSFLLPILVVGLFTGICFTIAGMAFGFSFRSIFAFILVILAGGWILYETSNILHHYRINQYIAASIILFHSVGGLFRTVMRSYRATNFQRIS